MSSIRLTREARDRVRLARSEARRRELSSGHGRVGMADLCYEAAGGDGLLALLYAVEAFRVMRPEEVERALNYKDKRRAPAPRDRVSYEELMQHA